MAEQNIQAGVPVGDGISDSDRRVATGDRRETAHFEPDKDQLVRAAFLRRPDGPLPPDLAQEPPADPQAQQVEDVRVAPPDPSVWDARPPDEEDGPPSA
jgi:hypothetical protein